MISSGHKVIDAQVVIKSIMDTDPAGRYIAREAPSDKHAYGCHLWWFEKNVRRDPDMRCKCNSSW